MKRATAPEAPDVESGEIPLNTPIVLKRAALGSRTFDTAFGKRDAVPVHVWTYDTAADESRYIGVVNVFWSSVRRQIAAALPDIDTLLPCYVVAVGERSRRELRNPENPDLAQAAADAVERSIVDDLADSEEDAPFIEPPAPF